MVRKLPKRSEDSLIYFKKKYGYNIFQVENDGLHVKQLRILRDRGFLDRIPSLKVGKKINKKYFWKIKNIKFKF
jgi:hypothetical protein